MNMYLKLFLATGIPFVIFWGIVNSFQYGFPVGLLCGLFNGIVVGGFLTFICGFSHRRSVKRMPYGKSEEAMGVHHLRNIELQLPYDKVFNLCIESLKSIKKCKIKKEERSQGKIVAQAGMTWKTWGDKISFEVGKISNDRTQVMLSSRPALRTTLLDR